MRPTSIAPFLLGLFALPGCSNTSPDSGQDNPAILWLAPDLVETRLKLAGSEPPPF